MQVVLVVPGSKPVGLLTDCEMVFRKSGTFMHGYTVSGDLQWRQNGLD